MRLGAYSHRITLAQPDTAQASGYLTVVANVPASIVAQAATAEQMAAGGPQALGTRIVKLHYRTDVKADWRVTDRETGAVFEVVGYGDEDGQRRELTLLCKVVQ